MTIHIKSKFKNRIGKQILNLAVNTDKSVSEIEGEIKKKLTVSQKQLTYWKKNKGEQPSIEQASLISKILKCELDDLIESK
jgi:hypothetical protein